MNDQEKEAIVVARGEAAKEIVHNKAFQAVMETLRIDKEDAIKELLSPGLNERHHEKISDLRKVVFFHDEMVARLNVLIEDCDTLLRDIHGDYETEQTFDQEM